MADYSDCVLKYEKKGTLIQRKSEDLYHMYIAHSIWNREKKRTQLIIDKFLGKITPDCFVEPKA
ncbi:MAG: hypothetical protein M1304_02530 [Candidatus Thermoplasmatota archaeon]|nr:hypothetical protein [Candidatus Thermoplasmatota archaeon]